MEKQNYNVIGVMSGTSLDGVDLAHIFFSVTNNKWTYKIKECETVPYSDIWVEKLKNGINLPKNDLEKLDTEYTAELSNIITFFINRYELKNIDAVCTHGHTILHQPQNGLTLQIGNLPIISKLVNQKVICNFRVQDVQLGGQGAPLVPIGDQILFSDYDYCLNLGGFSNVSFEENGNRIAFDISPVNTVLNFYAEKKGLKYDENGKTAASGSIDQKLLSHLNSLAFYKQNYPKSLGFEFVKTTIIPLIENYKISTEDKLRTFTEHIAVQIANALPVKQGQMLITGGGAYNSFLIEKIKEYTEPLKIIVPDIKTIEFKEALIFGLLGVLKLRNEVNTLSSVTGAKHDHSSGIIFEVCEK
ncbi:anhydro-N-acetylmuramic acid kinase [Flavobacterium sp. H122]|uniref:anhydro-N-acetylmuramic acid kinase n=1 Tax=Flavobacterium sp. H122 TaxID=2529860 RepID=UPI0010AAF64F|nr:anhydro-N-acetylmuramic acid kinase [Flavobacterium sp. H122]